MIYIDKRLASRRLLRYLLRQRWFLFRCTKFEKLLDNIISENVGHERVSGCENLLKHELLLACRGSLEFLLDEARAVLILTELDYVVSQIS